MITTTLATISLCLALFSLVMLLRAHRENERLRDQLDAEKAGRLFAYQSSNRETEAYRRACKKLNNLRNNCWIANEKQNRIRYNNASQELRDRAEGSN